MSFAKALKLLIAVQAVALTCADAQAQTTLERARRDGYIRVGFANERPASFVGPDGKIQGDSIEVLKAVLPKLGIAEFQPILVEFAGLIPALRANRIDVTTAMWILPQRCEQVAFSEAFKESKGGLIVQKGNPLKIDTYAAIAASPSAMAGAMAGGADANYLKTNGVPAERILTFPDNPSVVAALKAGRVQVGAFAGTSIGSLLESMGPEFQRADPFVFPGSGNGTGFGFRKEDRDLLAEFNKYLVAYRGTDDHLAATQKFGYVKSDLIATRSTAEYCTGPK